MTERLQREIARPVWLAGAEAKVAASFGIVMAKSWCDAAEELLMHADAAMYQAKQGGRARQVTHCWAEAAGSGMMALSGCA